MLIMTPNPVNSDQIWSMMANVDKTVGYTVYGVIERHWELRTRTVLPTIKTFGMLIPKYPVTIALILVLNYMSSTVQFKMPWNNRQLSVLLLKQLIMTNLRRQSLCLWQNYVTAISCTNSNQIGVTGHTDKVIPKN